MEIEGEAGKNCEIWIFMVCETEKKSKSDVDKRWIVLKQTQARIARLSAYFIEISKKN